MGSGAQSLLWKREVPSPVVGPPILGSDGTVYVASEDRKLRAYTSTGAISWEFKLQKTPSGPMAYQAGVLYVPTLESSLQAVHNTGNGLWEYRLQPRIVGAPALSADGHVLFATADDHLYSLTGGGSLRWKVDMGQPISQGPAIAEDGTIYQACRDELAAFSPGGQKLWSCEIAGNLLAPLAIGTGGEILAVDGGRNLHCLDRGGQRMWVETLSAAPASCPVVSADTVYVITSAGAEESMASAYSLLTFDSASGIPGWTESTGGAGTPALGGDNSIYLAASDSTLRTLDTSGDAEEDTGDDKYPPAQLTGKGGDIALAGESGRGRLVLVAGGQRIYAFEFPAGPGDNPWSQRGCTARRQSRRDPPPAITVSGISDGELIIGEKSFSVVLSDAEREGLSARFYVDGSRMSLLDRAPFDFVWSTAGTPNGLRGVMLEGIDLAGNSVTEALNVTVYNDPPQPAHFYADDPPFTFTWSPSDEERFRVEFALDSEFRVKVAASSEDKGPWLKAPSYTPSKGVWKKVLSVGKTQPIGDVTAFWRVVGKSSGSLYMESYLVKGATSVTPLSPPNGSSLPSATPAAFTYDLGHNSGVRLEFSSTQDFSTGVQFSSKTQKDPWWDGSSWLPSGKEWKKIVSIGSTVYWRIRSKDRLDRQMVGPVSGFSFY